MSRRREISEAAGALGERDQAILVALARHRLLTTEHIEALFFKSIRRAQAKVQELREKNLTSTLPSRTRGRRPDRHHLTDLGAGVAAFYLGRSPSDLGALTSEAELRKNLRHRLGVNDFFCRLILACDPGAAYGVHAWKDEHQIRRDGRQIQADAFGRLLHPEGAVEFFLEYDRGTEHFWAICAKLERYLAISSARTPDDPMPFPNVLFVVPTERREQMLRRAFAVAVERWDPQSARSAWMPFYTASLRLLGEEGHLGAAWCPLAAHATRLRLPELPATPECWWELSECLRVRWVEDKGEM